MIHLLLLILLIAQNNARSRCQCSSVEVIAAVELHYRSGWVYLLMDNSSGIADSMTYIHATKHLQKRGISSVVVPLCPATVLSLVTLKSSSSKPLIISLSDSPLLQRVLIEASEQTSLSAATWLIFLKTFSVNDFLSNVKISFDCEFLVAEVTEDSGTYYLLEVYKISENSQLVKQLFATFNKPNCHLDVSTPQLYERRSGLNRITITSTVFEKPPLSSLQYTHSGTRVAACVSGLWKILEEKMNFSTTQIAYKAVEGWEDLIGVIQRKEVDVASTVVAMTTERYRAVDFTIPLFLLSSQVFIRQPELKSVIWDKYVTPFSRYLWCSLIMMILLVAVVFVAMYRAARRHGLVNVKQHYYTYEAFFYAYTSLFCQQDHALKVRCGPIRMMFVVTYLTGVIVMSAYSAALFSSLATERTSIPFNSLEGLLADGTYKLGVPKKTVLYSLFKNAEEGLLKDIYVNMMDPDPDHYPANDLVGLQRLCEVEKYAFLAPKEFANSMSEKVKCKIVGLPGVFFKYWMAIPVTKKSPYLGLLNYNLQKLRVGGVLHELKMKVTSPHNHEQNTAKVVVKLRDVAPLLILLLVGMMMSTFVLAAEYGRQL